MKVFRGTYEASFRTAAFRSFILSDECEHLRKQRAVILGSLGQDGYFMSGLLTEDGYDVIRFVRPEDLSTESIPLLPRRTFFSWRGATATKTSIERSSGKLHSVKDVLTTAFGHVGLLEGRPRGNRSVSEPSSRTNFPLRTPSKIMRELNLEPRATLQDVVLMMADADLGKAF